MSLTDEGHYGPKQLNLLKVVWGEGFLSPGGTAEIDEIRWQFIEKNTFDGIEGIVRLSEIKKYRNQTYLN